MEIQHLSLDEWEALLPTAGVGPFHQPEVLTLMDEYELLEEASVTADD